MSEIKLVRPDILDCLANLSSDEVFTPPKVVNEMLDMLPQDLFESPKTRFLDPFTKSGVFLREIVKRLDRGLVRTIPDREGRLNHIFQRQVYGIACTQLTALFSRRSLYCNKNVQDKRSTARGLFSTEAGNIGYHRCHHTWVNGSCKVCGASKKALSESKDVENYAYPFLHDEVFMKQAQELGFDVIIGNPPYQMSDGGSAGGAVPIYHLFVEQAKKLNPRYLSMIIPSRWFAGGRGLDEFREVMKTDRHIKCLVDYPKSRDCFSGVDIAGGVCYFLRDKEYVGSCEFISRQGESEDSSKRFLDEFNVVIRDSRGVDIIHKVQSFNERPMSDVMLTVSPFGLRSFERGSERKTKDGVVVISSKGTGYINRSDVKKNSKLINQYKVFVGYLNPDRAGVNNAADCMSNVITKIRFAGPNEVVTETYIVPFCSKVKSEVENCASYLRTRFARLLIYLTLSSMHIAQSNLSFVPMQDFSKPWTDAELYRKYKLTDQEIEFIESMIRPME